MSVWSALLAGLGIALFLEGLPYFVSPPAMRRWLAAVAETSDAAMRAVGFTAMAAGLLLAWIATR